MSRLLSNSKYLLFILLLVFWAGFTPSALAINLGAKWEYIQQGGEDREPQTEIRELYYLSFGNQLTYRPTHAISLNAGATYRRNQDDITQSTRTYNALYPYVNLGLANDIFNISLSGSTDITLTESNNRTTKRSESSWETALASAWAIPLWPSLRFSFGEQFVPVRNASIFAATSQKQQNANFNMNWDLILAKLYYNYSQSKNVVPVNNFVQESSSHFARLETFGRFWDDRIRFNFAQRFNLSTLDTSGRGEESPFPDFVPGRTVSKIDSAVDPNPPDPLYVDPEPDQNLPQAVEINERVHFLFTTDNSFPESIDFLLLTFQGTLTENEVLALRWNLYTRTDPSEDWGEPVIESIQGQLSTLADNSIEIPIDIEAAEILVMATTTPGASLNFTSLQAFSVSSVGSSVDGTAYRTNFSMSYDISRSLRARTTLTLNHSETTADTISNEQDSRFVSASLHWSPIPLVSPTLQFSENKRSETLSAIETVNRVYSMIVATRPLPLMNISYGISLNERYNQSQKTFTSTQHSITTAARIYPDLAANFRYNYTLSETLDNDGLISNITSSSIRLDLAAKLYQALTANFITNYGFSKNDAGKVDSGSMLFSMQYIPSDLLALRGSYRTTFLVPELNDNLNLSLSLQLLNTYKTHLTLRANHTQNVRSRENNSTTESLYLDGNWNINKNFSLSGRANYTFADIQSYGFRLLVVLRLL